MKIVLTKTKILSIQNKILGPAQVQCILHLVACCPSLVPHFGGKLPWIKGFLNNTKEVIRYDVAR